MTGAPVTIAFANHWRAEVGDVADALREVSGSGARVVGGGRWFSPVGRTPSVLVLSDPAPPAAQPEPADRLPTARLWWNDSPEVHQAAGEGRVNERELHVAFFPETAAAFRSLGFAVLELPYAFAAPLRVRAPKRTQVTYTGEVDATDECFSALPPERARALSALATDIAVEVVAGNLRLTAAADAVVRGDAVEDRDLVLWSVRNRVRFRLVQAIVDAFPGQVALRGTDWRQHGFNASSTPFRRITRRRSYRQSRVALDFGAKSGNAVLSPRSAEIIAVGGGLAQFDSGAGLPQGLAAVTDHQAASAAALVDLIARDLGADDATAKAARRALQSEYVEVRRASSVRLLDALLQHAGQN